MINKKYLALHRSRILKQKNTFFYDLISKRLVDSLDLINFNFKDVLELGINENNTQEYLKEKHNTNLIFRTDISEEKTKTVNGKKLLLDIDNWTLKENQYDLIFSNLYIHLSNDFNKLIQNIYYSLKPNGFFIAALPNESNFYQVKKSMFKVDMQLYNGIYRRDNNYISINKLIESLKEAKFKIPVVNSEKVLIEYNSFDKLLIDLKNLNLSNCHEDRLHKLEKKNYFKILNEIYKKSFYIDKNYQLSLNINIMSGWKNIK